MKRLTLVLFAVVIASPGLADDDRAQSDTSVGTTAAGQFFDRADIVIANVDVVVTDSKGDPVHGLTKDDFEIRENGTLQTITNFATYDTQSIVSTTDVAPRQAESDREPVAKLPPRLIVLFIDISEMEPNRRERFFGSVRSFLDDAFRDGDALAVLTWNRHILTLLPPTVDRRRVELVLDGLSKPFGNNDKKVFRELSEQAVEQSESDASASNAFGTGMLIDAEADRDFEEWALVEGRCDQIKRKAKELRNVLASLSRVELRKVLIFASDDLALNPRDLRGRVCSTVSELEELAMTANAYGMTIHALHPPGERDSFIGPDRGYFLPGTTNTPAPMSGPYARTYEEAGGLNLIAERTGGLLGIGLRGERVLEQIAAGLESYYSLGYKMSPGNEDKPRKLDVTTKNRSYRVRARESVVRLSEESRIRDLVTSSLYLPERANVQTPSFSAHVTERSRDGRFDIAKIEVSIRAGDLTLLPAPAEGFRGSFSVFLSAGRLPGDASDVVEVTKEVGARSKIENESRLSYTFSARIRPDTRRLSIAVRDNVSGDIAIELIPLQGSDG